MRYAALSFSAMQFYDNASPPIAGQGKNDRYQWTIPGLFDGWNCRSVSWWERDTIVLGCQSVSADGTWGDRPSILVFLSTSCPRKKGQDANILSDLFGNDGSCSVGNDYVLAIIELWLDKDQPLYASMSGMTKINDFFYVSDDQPASWAFANKRKSLIYVFKVDDLQAVVNQQGERMYVSIDPLGYNTPMVIDAPATPSSLSYDEMRLGNDRLWILEHYETPTAVRLQARKSIVGNLFTAASAALNAANGDLASSAGSVAEALLIAKWDTKSGKTSPRTQLMGAAFGFPISAASGTSGLPVMMRPAAKWTIADIAPGTGLFTYQQQQRGLLKYKRFKLDLKDVGTRTMFLGPGARAAIFGYEGVNVNGPMYGVLSRCPLGSSQCNLEFHALENFHLGTLSVDKNLGVTAAGSLVSTWDLLSPAIQGDIAGKNSAINAANAKDAAKAASAKKKADAAAAAGAAKAATQAAKSSKKGKRRRLTIEPPSEQPSSPLGRSLSLAEKRDYISQAFALPHMRVAFERTWPDQEERVKALSALASHYLENDDAWSTEAVDEASLNVDKYMAGSPAATAAGNEAVVRAWDLLQASAHSNSSGRRLLGGDQGAAAEAADSRSGTRSHFDMHGRDLFSISITDVNSYTVLNDANYAPSKPSPSPTPGPKAPDTSAVRPLVTPITPDESTLQFAMRVPPGVVGISYEPEWTSWESGDKSASVTDLSATRHLLALTNTASDYQYTKSVIAGFDVDDAIYKMRMPVVKSAPPGISDNIIFARLLSIDMFTPRCVVPVGKYAMDDGEEDKSIFCSGSCKGGSGSGKKLRLLYSDLAVNNQATDLSRSLSLPLAPALSGEASIHHVQEAFPLQAHLVAREGPAGAGKARRGTDARGLRAAARLLVQMDNSSPVDASYRVLYATPDENSYQYARFLAASAPSGANGEANGGKDECGGDTVEGKKVDKLDYGNKLPDLKDMYKTQIKPTPFDMAQDGCISGSPITLYDKYKQFFRFEETIIVVFVPVFFFFEIGGQFTVQFGIRLCIQKKEITFGVMPSVGVIASAGGGINLFLIKAGIGVSATLCQTTLIPTLSISITPSGSLRICVNLDMEIKPLQLDFYAFYQLFVCIKIIWVDIGIFSIPLPWLYFCPETRYSIFTWSLMTIKMNLFSVCTGPYDTTPPSLGWVNATQKDTNTIAVSWAGFIDKESNIDHYEVSIGTSPGGTEITDNSMVGTGGSTFAYDIALGDKVPFYVSLVAVNGEGLRTGASTRAVYWQKDPLSAIDVRVQRPYDGLYIDNYCASPGKSDPWTGVCVGSKSEPVYTNDPNSVSLSFRLDNVNPSVSISRAQFAVCADPICAFQDVAGLPWTDVGRSQQLDAQDTDFPIVVTTYDANLRHNGIYYALVSLMTSASVVGNSLPSIPIKVDLTPPIHGAWVWDGPTADIDFQQSTTTVSAKWAPFTDAESGVASYTMSLMDADGGYLAGPIDVKSETQGTIYADLIHGERYFVQVTATNKATSESDPFRSNGFIVDVTPPVFAPDVVMASPWVYDDAWLLNMAQRDANASCFPARCPTATYTAYTEPVAVGNSWSRSPVTRVLPKMSTAVNVSADASVNASDPNWAAALQTAYTDKAYRHSIINGETGALLTMRVRFACADPESYTVPGVGFGGAQIAVGTYSGGSDALPFTQLNNTIHPYLAPASDWLPPNAYTKPGVYRTIRYNQYYDTVLRVPTNITRHRYLFASVRCVNGAGVVGVSTSNDTVFHDATSPLFPLPDRLVDGLAQRVDIASAFTKNTTNFLVTWEDSALDPESGLADGTNDSPVYAYSLALGTKPGASDLAPVRTFSGNTTSAFYSNLTLKHNSTVYATMSIFNRAIPYGTTTVTTAGIKVDLTPPVMVAVNDGSPAMVGTGAIAWRYRNTNVTGLGDVDVQAVTGAAFSNWVGYDSESGVRTWTSQVVDGSTGSILVEASVVQGTVSVKAMASPATHGQKLVTKVFATNMVDINSATMSSNGVIVDLTPPVIGNFVVNSATKLLGPSLLVPAYNVSLRVITSADPRMSFSWTATEDYSRVPECWVSIGSFPGGDDVLAHFTVNATMSFTGTKSSLGLVSGLVYYPSVTCINTAGLFSTVPAPNLGVDVSPPFLYQVQDGSSLTDVDAQSSVYSAFMNFGRPVDVHTSVKSCSVSLRLVGNSGDAAAADAFIVATSSHAIATNATTASFVFTGSSTMPVGQKIYSCITCTDAVDNTGTACSDSFTIDNTPPVLLGDPSTAVLPGLLSAMNPYTGVIDMDAPPDIWSSTTTELGVRFKSFTDLESGIASYAIGVSTVQSATTPPDVFPFADLGPVTYALVGGLNLTQSKTYYLVLKATNNVNLTSYAVSSGITVDITPPVCDWVQDVTPASLAVAAGINVTAANPSIVTSATVNVTSMPSLVNASVSGFPAPLTVVYRCYDPESGMASVSLAVGPVPGDATLVPLTKVPLPSSAASVPVVGAAIIGHRLLTAWKPLKNGNAYITSVLATNGAGFSTVAYSKGTRFDVTAPVLYSSTSGLVDGPDDLGNPIVATANFTHITVSYRFLEIESGFASFWIGVGYFNGSALTGQGITPSNPAAPMSAIASPYLSVYNGVDKTVEATSWLSIPVDAGATFAYGSSLVLPIPDSIRTRIAMSAEVPRPRHPAVTVFAAARVVNVLGLAASYRSPGAVIDMTPPVCAALTTKAGVSLRVLDGTGNSAVDGSGPRTDIDLSPISDALYGRWSCDDPESGAPTNSISGEVWNVTVARYPNVTCANYTNTYIRRNASGKNVTTTNVTTICTAAAYDVYNGTWISAGDFNSVGRASSGATSAADVIPGAKMRLVVRSVNRAGMATVVYSDGVVTDSSPPEVPVPPYFPSPYAGQYISTSSWVAFNLSGVRDNETGVSQVWYTVSLRPGMNDVVGKTLIADANVPVLPSVTPSVTPTPTSSRTPTPSATPAPVYWWWSWFWGWRSYVEPRPYVPPPSPSPSSRPTPPPVPTPRPLISTMTQLATRKGALVNISGLSLVPGARLYITVGAVNKVGRETTVDLNPISYVNGPPRVGTVKIVSLGLPAGHETQSGWPNRVNNVSVTVGLSQWYDRTAGVADMQVAILMAAPTWLAPSNTGYNYWPQYNLFPEQFDDRLGQWINVTLPPYPGYQYRDACQSASNMGYNLNNHYDSFARNWNPAWGWVVMPWTSIGPDAAISPSVTFNNLIVCGQNMRLFAVVRTISGAAIRSANAISPPNQYPMLFGAVSVGYINNGQTWATNKNYDNIGNQLSAYWGGFRESTGALLMSSIGFGTVPGEADLSNGFIPRPWIQPGNDASYTMFLNKSLADGTKVYATVIVTNGKTDVKATSRGMLVDSTAPVVPYFVLGRNPAVNITGFNSYEGVWVSYSCVDDGTDVSRVSIGLGTRPGDTNLQSPIWFRGVSAGASRVFLLRGYVAPGTTVYGVLTCTNGAELTTTVVTPPAVADISPPVPVQFTGSGPAGIAVGNLDSTSLATTGSAFAGSGLPNSAIDAFASQNLLNVGGNATSNFAPTLQYIGNDTAFVVSWNIIDPESSVATQSICIATNLDEDADIILPCTVVGRTSRVVVALPNISSLVLAGVKSRAAAVTGGLKVLQATQGIYHGQDLVISVTATNLAGMQRTTTQAATVQLFSPFAPPDAPIVVSRPTLSGRFKEALMADLGVDPQYAMRSGSIIVSFNAFTPYDAPLVLYAAEVAPTINAASSTANMTRMAELQKELDAAMTATSASTNMTGTITAMFGDPGSNISLTGNGSVFGVNSDGSFAGFPFPPPNFTNASAGVDAGNSSASDGSSSSDGSDGSDPSTPTTTPAPAPRTIADILADMQAESTKPFVLPTPLFSPVYFTPALLSKDNVTGGYLLPITIPSAVTLVPGRNYSVYITAYDAAGQYAVTSVWFTVDSGMPVARWVRNGNNGSASDVTDAVTWGDRRSFNAAWSFTDDAGLAPVSYTWSVCAANTAAYDGPRNTGDWWAGFRLANCLFPPTFVGASTSASIGGLAMMPTVEYHTVVLAVDGAKRQSVGVSRKFVLDPSPPVPGRVLIPAIFIAGAADISASFERWQDAESSIVGYSIAVGTSPGQPNALNWTSLDISAATGITMTGTPLAMQMKLGADRGMYIARLAVHAPQTNLTLLDTVIASLLQAAVNKATFRLYIGIRGYTDAGLSSSAWSAPLIIDSVAPHMSDACALDVVACARAAGINGAQAPNLGEAPSPVFFVYTNVSASGQPQYPLTVMTGSTDPTRVTVAVAGVTTGISGLSHYYIVLEQCSIVADEDELLDLPAIYSCKVLVPSTRLETNKPLFTLGQLALPHGTMVRANVTAVSNSGAHTTFVSRGFFVVDLVAPPDVGQTGGKRRQVVGDGWGPNLFYPPTWPVEQTTFDAVDVNYWPSATTFAAWWSLYDDLTGSGLVRFTVSVCRKAVTLPVPGDAVACPVYWRDVGRSNAATFNGLNLIDNEPYVTWVTAYDGAGNSNVYQSDGTYIDTTGPVTSRMFVTASTMVGDWRYINVTAVGAFDDDSGIDHYDVCFTISSPNARGAAPAIASKTYDGLQCTSIGRSLTTSLVNIGALIVKYGKSTTWRADVDKRTDGNVALFQYQAEQDTHVIQTAAILNPIIHVYNRALLPASIALPPILLDLTLPTRGDLMVMDPSLWEDRKMSTPTRALITDSDHGTRNTSYVALAFFGSGDLDTPIVQYSVAIGNLECRSDILAPTPVDLASLPPQNKSINGTVIPPVPSGSILLGNLDLPVNKKYFLTLYMRNGAGLVQQVCQKSTSTMWVDIQNPAAGFVVDVPASLMDGNGTLPASVSKNYTVGYAKAKPVYTAIPTVVAVWTLFSDSLSGIAYYQTRVCDLTDGSACDNTPWSARLPSNTTWSSVAIGMTPGIPYVTQVKAVDYAGNFNISQSKGTTFDDSPPDPPTFIHLSRPMTSWWGTIAVLFDVFIDQESGIARHEYCIGLPGRPCILSTWQDIGINTSFTVAADVAESISLRVQADPSLDDGWRPRRFVVRVRATNGVGLQTEISVNGAIDDTAPTPGQVAFVDLSSAAAGTTKETAAAAAMAAAAQAKYDAEATGNDPVPVVATGAEVGIDPSRLTIAEYSTSSTSLAIRITGLFDREDPQPLYTTYCIGTAPGSCDFIPTSVLLRVPVNKYRDAVKARLAAAAPTPANSPTGSDLIILNHLNMTQGGVYYCKITATNQAGLTTVINSEAIVVDATAPVSLMAGGPAPVLIDLLSPLAENGPEVELNSTNTSLASSTTSTTTATTSNSTSNATAATVPTVGYGGAGTPLPLYGTLPVQVFSDVDWTGIPSLTFAWANGSFVDAESGIAVIEWSVVELQQEENYHGVEKDVDALDDALAQYMAASASSGSSRRLFVESSPLAPAAARRAQTTPDYYNSSSDDYAPMLANFTATYNYTGYNLTYLPVSAYRSNDTLTAGLLGEDTVDPYASVDPASSKNEPFVATASHPVQAGTGRLSGPSEFWGGKVLRPFTQIDVTSSNVTVQGLKLRRGHMYAAVLRVWNGAGSFTQLMSDGVVFDDGEPCMGGLQLVNVRDKAGSLVTGIDQDTIRIAMGSKRPPFGAFSSSDEASTVEGEGAGAGGATYYSPSATSINLAWLHFADPWIQRPGKAQRLTVCSDVDGFGTDVNSAIDGGVPVPAPYTLAAAPISGYAIEVWAISEPGNASAAPPGAPPVNTSGADELYRRRRLAQVAPQPAAVAPRMVASPLTISLPSLQQPPASVLAAATASSGSAAGMAFSGLLSRAARGLDIDETSRILLVNYTTYPVATNDTNTTADLTAPPALSASVAVPYVSANTTLLPASSPCCSNGYEDPARLPLPIPDSRGSISASTGGAVVKGDVELRPPMPLTRFGSSIAITQRHTSLTSVAGLPSYAIAAAANSTLLITPLHRRDGARLLLPLSTIPGLASINASKTPMVAASRGVPPVISSYVDGLNRTIPGWLASGGIAPIVVATDAALVVLEMRIDASAVIRASMNMMNETGTDAEASSTAAAAERWVSSALIRPGTKSMFYNLSATGSNSFGAAVAIYNRTVAVTGRDPRSSASATARVVGVFAALADPSTAYRNLLLDSTNPYQWDDWKAVQVPPPVLGRVKKVTGAIACSTYACSPAAIANTVPLPTITADAWGTALSVSARSLAVGTPGSITLYSYDPTVNTLYGTSAGKAPDAASEVLPRGMLTNTTAAKLDAAAIVIAEPDQYLKGGIATANSGFGTVLASNDNIIVATAPAASSGRGRLYAYSNDANARLLCWFEGAFPNASMLGESVAVTDVPSKEQSMGTLGLVTVSVRVQHFKGLALRDVCASNNATLKSYAGAFVLAVRNESSARAQIQAQSIARLRTATNASTNALLAAGVPMCSYISLVLPSEINTTAIDESAQLGTNATADDVFKRLQACKRTPVALAAPVAVAASPHGVLVSSVAEVGWDASTHMLADGWATSLVGANGSVAALLSSNTSSGLNTTLIAALRSLDGTATGSGRVHFTAFCPRDSIRALSSFGTAGLAQAVPYTCEPCPASYSSFGGMSTVCTACGSAALDPSVPASAQSMMCAGALGANGTSPDVNFNFAYSGLNLTSGGLYKVSVKAITGAGRWREVFSDQFMVDATGPVGIAVDDGIRDNGDGSTSGFNSEIDYTNITSQASFVWSGGQDPESGLASFAVGMSTVPCDGVFHRACPVRKLAPSRRDSPLLSPCSGAVRQHREQLATRYGFVTSALTLTTNPLGSAAWPLPVNPSTVFDVRPLATVSDLATRNTTFTGLSLLHGKTYYACVAATNKAGVTTYASSDGFTIDSTPGAVSVVRDGVFTPDWDYQNYLDMLAANWDGDDFESGSTMGIWTVTNDTSVVVAANRTASTGGRVDWDAVADALPKPLFNWESVGSSPFSAKVQLPLSTSATYSACIRFQNGAGLMSAITCSNGVQVGKSEVKPAPDKKTAMGFETYSSTEGGYANQAEARAAKAQTVGTLEMPPGAMGGSTGSLRAGGVKPGDAAGDPTLVDPTTTTPPANNFKFGNYSFALRAYDDSGSAINGFVFAKPITITMAYDVGSLASRTSSTSAAADATTWAPQLNFWSTVDRKWMNARDTCNPPFETIDYDMKTYSVNICHLTQWGLFYAPAPLAIMAPQLPNATGVQAINATTMAVINSTTASSMYAQALSLANNRSAVPSELQPAFIVDGSLGVQLLLDVSSSRDDDGVTPLQSVNWTLSSAPMLQWMEEEIARPDSNYTAGDLGLALAAIQPLYLFPSAPVGGLSLNATTAPANSMPAGMWVFTAIITSNGGVSTPVSRTIFINRCPTPVLSRSFYLPKALLTPSLASAPANTPVSGSETSTEYNTAFASISNNDIVLDGSLSADAENNAFTALWELIPSNSTVVDTTAPAPVIVSPTSLVTAVIGLTSGAYAFRLTLTDTYGSSCTTTVMAGQPLVTRVVGGSVHRATTNSIGLSIADTVSIAPLSQLVDVQWSITSTPAGLGASGTAAVSRSGLLTASLTGMVDGGNYSITVAATDAMGAVSSEDIIVRRKLLPVAVLSSAPPFERLEGAAPEAQIYLDARASYDPDDGEVAVYTWSVAYTATDFPAAFGVAGDFNASSTPLFAPVDLTTGRAASDAAPQPANNLSSSSTSAYLAITNRLAMGSYMITLAVADAYGSTGAASQSTELQVGGDGYPYLPSYVMGPSPSPSPSPSASSTPSPSASVTPISATASPWVSPLPLSNDIHASNDNSSVSVAAAAVGGTVIGLIALFGVYKVVQKRRRRSAAVKKVLSDGDKASPAAGGARHINAGNSLASPAHQGLANPVAASPSQMDVPFAFKNPALTARAMARPSNIQAPVAPTAPGSAEAQQPNPTATPRTPSAAAQVPATKQASSGLAQYASGKGLLQTRKSVSAASGNALATMQAATRDARASPRASPSPAPQSLLRRASGTSASSSDSQV